MENAHRQRLVGGIVIVALLLILVPTILDFTQETTSPVQQAEIPGAPDAMKMEVLPLDVWSEKTEPQVDESALIVETPAPAAAPALTQTPAPAPAESKATAPEQSKPEPQPQQTAQPQAAAPAPAPAKSEAKIDTPAPAAIPPGTSAWVIQIASFSEEPKAFALRDQLRQAGHPVFIERVANGKGAVYRVKVGPVLERAEADRLQGQIAKQTRLKGLVMVYR